MRQHRFLVVPGSATDQQIAAMADYVNPDVRIIRNTALSPDDIRPIVTNARAVKPKPTKEKR